MCHSRIPDKYFSRKLILLFFHYPLYLYSLRSSLTKIPTFFNTSRESVQNGRENSPSKPADQQVSNPADDSDHQRPHDLKSCFVSCERLPLDPNVDHEVAIVTEENGSSVLCDLATSKSNGLDASSSTTVPILRLPPEQEGTECFENAKRVIRIRKKYLFFHLFGVFFGLDTYKPSSAQIYSSAKKYNCI